MLVILIFKLESVKGLILIMLKNGKINYGDFMSKAIHMYLKLIQMLQLKLKKNDLYN
jgi:hypothetical protein